MLLHVSGDNTLAQYRIDIIRRSMQLIGGAANPRVPQHKTLLLTCAYTILHQFYRQSMDYVKVYINLTG